MLGPGRVYTATFASLAGLASNGDFELFALLAPGDLALAILRIHIAQTTDIKDAGELIEIIRMRSEMTTVGSGGAAVPVNNINPTVKSNPVSTATIRSGDTTVATGGTPKLHHHWGWNIRVPFDQIWTPEEAHLISPDDRVTFDFPEAIGSDMTLFGTVTYMEIGG